MLHVLKSASMALLLTLSATVLAQSDSLSVFSDMDGNPQQLEDYTGDGKWLVVMIWASDCHICNMEAPTYNTFHEAQRGKNISVLGISMDGEENKAAAKKFTERHNLSFPNLIGEPGMVSLYYAAMTQESLRGTPTFLVYNPDGEIVAAQAGAVSVDAIESFIAKKNAARLAKQ
jgi:peroxiredoxin